jgi:hypothetical protein
VQDGVSNRYICARRREETCGRALDSIFISRLSDFFFRVGRQAPERRGAQIQKWERKDCAKSILVNRCTSSSKKVTVKIFPQQRADSALQNSRPRQAVTQRYECNTRTFTHTSTILTSIPLVPCLPSRPCCPLQARRARYTCKGRSWGGVWVGRKESGRRVRTLYRRRGHAPAVGAGRRTARDGTGQLAIHRGSKGRVN